jgi:hypothetical protein
VNNNNLCSYVAGSCVENPCKKIGCESEVTPGCTLDGTICVVDECMKYDENECKSEGASICVIVENKCVVGECSMLGVQSDCSKNDEKCKVVGNVCVENPCDNAECTSPACLLVNQQCTYDTCAQYAQEGMSIQYLFFNK